MRRETNVCGGSEFAPTCPPPERVGHEKLAHGDTACNQSLAAKVAVLTGRTTDLFSAI